MNDLVAKKMTEKMNLLLKEVKMEKNCPSNALSEYKGFLDGLVYAKLISDFEMKIFLASLKDNIIKCQKRKQAKHEELDEIINIIILLSLLEEMEEEIKNSKNPFEEFFRELMK